MFFNYFFVLVTLLSNLLLIFNLVTLSDLSDLFLSSIELYTEVMGVKLKFRSVLFV